MTAAKPKLEGFDGLPEPFSGDHFMGRPSRPAMEVKVPHS